MKFDQNKICFFKVIFLAKILRNVKKLRQVKKINVVKLQYKYFASHSFSYVHQQRCVSVTIVEPSTLNLSMLGHPMLFSNLGGPCKKFVNMMDLGTILYPRQDTRRLAISLQHKTHKLWSKHNYKNCSIV